MIKKSDVKEILIMGAAGGLAVHLIKRLVEIYPEARIVGVDVRKLKDTIYFPNVEIKQIKYKRSQFEKLFRAYKFDLFFHLGRLSHEKTFLFTSQERFNFNILGTQNLLDLCLQHKVKKIVVLSTYHVYGALADNAVFLREEAPLRASHYYPEIRDVVEMDIVCTSWMWRHRDKVSMVLFRPSNIVGPNIKNAVSTYLRSKIAPVPIDYSPALQFISERDMVSVLIKSIEELPAGPYNLAPDDYISIQRAKKIIGVFGIPCPIFALSGVAKVFKKTIWSVPDYLFDYLKFPCLLSNTHIKSHLGEEFYQDSSVEALKSLKLKGNGH